MGIGPKALRSLIHWNCLGEGFCTYYQGDIATLTKIERANRVKLRRLDLLRLLVGCELKWLELNIFWTDRTISANERSVRCVPNERIR